jgi:hypothetical protein
MSAFVGRAKRASCRARRRHRLPTENGRRHLHQRRARRHRASASIWRSGRSPRARYLRSEALPYVPRKGQVRIAWLPDDRRASGCTTATSSSTTRWVYDVSRQYAPASVRVACSVIRRLRTGRTASASWSLCPTLPGSYIVLARTTAGPIRSTAPPAFSRFSRRRTRADESRGARIPGTATTRGKCPSSGQAPTSAKRRRRRSRGGRKTSRRRSAANTTGGVSGGPATAGLLPVLLRPVLVLPP